MSRVELKRRAGRTRAQDGKTGAGSENGTFTSRVDRLTQLFDYAPIAYITFDEKAIIREANLTAGRLLRLPAARLIGLPFSAVVNSPEVEKFFSHLRRCRAGKGDTIMTTLALRGRNNQILPAQLITMGFQEPDATFYHTALIDLTALKAVEVELQQARKHADYIVQNVQHPLAILDSDLVVQSVNTAFCDEFRTDPTALQGFALDTHAHFRWSFPHLREVLHAVIVTGTRRDKVRVEGELFGARRIFLVSAKRFYRQGHPSILLALENVTDRVTFEEEMVRAGEILETRVAERTQELGAANQRLSLLTQQLQQAQEEERLRLSRELHDEVGQIVTGLKLMLEHSIDQAPKNLRPRLRESYTVADQLQTRLQKLSLDLRPLLLDELRLAGALRAHLHTLRRQTGLSISFRHTPLPPRFPRNFERIAFRFVQEALTNVVRHSRAKRATVRLWCDKSVLCAQVEDNGIGFVPELVGNNSCGLTGIRERVSGAGGQFTLESEPGKGSKLTVELPFKQARRISA